MSKKLIAGAGVVASLAVALAPLATFATKAQNASDEHTDKLVVTVPSVCTFGSYAKDANASPTGVYPGGITHDSYTGTAGQNDDTSWDTNATAETTPWTNHPGVETNHNSSDVASTGYPSLAADIAITGGTANASYHTVHRTMLAGNATDTFAQTVMYIVCNDGGGYTVTATADANLTDGTNNIPLASTYSATDSGYTLKTIAGSTGVTTSNAAAASYSDTVIATNDSASAVNGDTLTVTYGMGIASNQPASTYVGEVVYKLYKGVDD